MSAYRFLHDLLALLRARPCPMCAGSDGTQECDLCGGEGIA